MIYFANKEYTDSLEEENIVSDSIENIDPNMQKRILNHGE